MKINEFQSYQSYLALKLHFDSDNYDYFKYNGKVSASLKSFEKRKDKYHFVRLAKKYNDKTIIEYYVANFIAGNKWIGDMSEGKYKDWLAKVQSIEYIFGNDVEKLLTMVPEFDILFNSEQGNHPKLLKAYLGKKITLETLVILQKLLYYRKTFDKEISEQFIWPKIGRLINKYEPFLDVNKWKLKTIAISKVQEFQDGR